MTFTESVRSRHVPETSSTCAWPPSSPSVPTSRATRVTSSANDESRSTIALIVRASAATSPLASTVTFWLRSPSATAVVTAAIWRTWSVRLDAITFTESVRSRQVPDTPLQLAHDVAPARRQAHREVSLAGRRERADDLLKRFLDGRRRLLCHPGPLPRVRTTPPQPPLGASPRGSRTSVLGPPDFIGGRR